MTTQRCTHGNLDAVCRQCCDPITDAGVWCACWRCEGIPDDGTLHGTRVTPTANVTDAVVSGWITLSPDCAEYHDRATDWGRAERDRSRRICAVCILAACAVVAVALVASRG